MVSAKDDEQSIVIFFMLPFKSLGFMGLPKGFVPFLLVLLFFPFPLDFLFRFCGQVVEFYPSSLDVLDLIVLHIFLLFLPSSKPLILFLGTCLSSVSLGKVLRGVHHPWVAKRLDFLLSVCESCMLAYIFFNSVVRI